MLSPASCDLADYLPAAPLFGWMDERGWGRNTIPSYSLHYSQVPSFYTLITLWFWQRC